jgi:hypothetical protein
MSNLKNRNGGRAFAGLILVVIGAALLLRNMDFFYFPGWLFTWPMILIIIGIYSGIRSGFRNNGWIILIGIGGFFLVDEEFIPGLAREPFFWPLVIIGLGVLFLLRPHRDRDRNWKSYKRDDSNYDKSQFSPSGFSREETADSGDYLHISSVFSGVNRRVLSKNFQGGNISCVFGGAEVDLTQADINGRVIIRLEQVFGGIKLKVPPHWTVLNEIDGVFHGVDDKRNYQTTTIPDPAKILVLKGSSVFAGIEIRSY